MNAHEEQIQELLKGVMDPELMVNIVDLGLVYRIAADSENKNIQVEITLTSQGCPLGDVIINNAREVILAKFTEYEIDLHLVWDPVWDASMLSDEGKAALAK